MTHLGFKPVARTAHVAPRLARTKTRLRASPSGPLRTPELRISDSPLHPRPPLTRAARAGAPLLDPSVHGACEHGLGGGRAAAGGAAIHLPFHTPRDAPPRKGASI